MNTLKSLGVGAVSFALILLVVIGGYNLLALNLGTVTGDYFKGALAVVVLLGGMWLSMQGLGFIGKPFMFAATLLLVVISVRYRVPGVAEFFSQTAKAADRTAERAAVDIAAARVIPCDRTTVTLRFFERESGRPLVWLSENADGRLICYDRPGYHPQTRRVLVPVDERLALRVLEQEPSGPHPLPSPTPAPTQPEPAPDIRLVASLPDLDGRPITK